MQYVNRLTRRLFLLVGGWHGDVVLLSTDLIINELKVRVSRHNNNSAAQYGQARSPLPRREVVLAEAGKHGAWLLFTLT